MQRGCCERIVWMKWTKSQALFTEYTSQMVAGWQKEMRFKMRVS